MKREPSEMLVTNPIERLLDALPALIADQKRELLQRDLKMVGEWEHYRQNLSKPGKDIGRASARAMVIIKKHLGVTDTFFVGSSDDQDEEIRRIATEYHNHTLFPA